MAESDKIDFTEDGVHYETHEVESPKITYQFSEEGMKLLDSETNEIIGAITWRELSSAGGDTYYPGNVRIATQTDNEIVLGFDDAEKGENAVRITQVNGVPQIIMDDGSISTPKTTANFFELRQPNGTVSGASVQANDDGDLIFTVPHDGKIWNVSLTDLVNAVWGGFD